MIINKNIFNEKVVIITGASSGIGKATAMAFANEGAKIILADVQQDAGNEVASKIEAIGGKAQFVECNVSNENDVQNLIKKTVKAFGRIDYAFNNAGIEGKQDSTSDCSVENWDQVIDINLKGVWLCMKNEIIQMLKQGNGGSIVNCSSIAGLVGFTGLPAYVASKHGVVGLTKTAALEYAKLNIRVNAVCPGVIETPMIDRFVRGEEQVRKQLIDSEPIGRIGQPEEIAQAVPWLCSDASSFVTGHSMVVDGGWVAQ